MFNIPLILTWFKFKFKLKIYWKCCLERYSNDKTSNIWKLVSIENRKYKEKWKKNISRRGRKEIIVTGISICDDKGYWTRTVELMDLMRVEGCKFKIKKI